MKTIELSDIAALSPHLESASAEPVVVRSHGKTLAAVVPVNDDDVESLLLSINPRFQRILERSEDRLRSEGSLSADEVRRRLTKS
jgi:peptide deformylase